MKITAASLLLLPAIILAPALNARTWTDKQGRTLEADLVRIISDHSVEVRRHADGKQFVLQTRQLSPEDQRFVSATHWREKMEHGNYEPTTLSIVSSLPDRIYGDDVWIEVQFSGIVDANFWRRDETDPNVYRNRTSIFFSAYDSSGAGFNRLVATEREFGELLLGLKAYDRLWIAGQLNRDGYFVCDHIQRITPSTP